MWFSVKMTLTTVNQCKHNHKNTQCKQQPSPVSIEMLIFTSYLLRAAGVVRSVKETLSSQFVDNCKGVIERLTLKEEKMVWNRTTHLWLVNEWINVCHGQSVSLFDQVSVFRCSHFWVESLFLVSGYFRYFPYYMSGYYGYLFFSVLSAINHLPMTLIHSLQAPVI